jgi:hypothetical protein
VKTGCSLSLSFSLSPLNNRTLELPLSVARSSRSLSRALPTSVSEALRFRSSQVGTTACTDDVDVDMESENKLISLSPPVLLLLLVMVAVLPEIGAIQVAVIRNEFEFKFELDEKAWLLFRLPERINKANENRGVRNRNMLSLFCFCFYRTQSCIAGVVS